jgi:hypothetical protein
VRTTARMCSQIRYSDLSKVSVWCAHNLGKSILKASTEWLISLSPLRRKNQYILIPRTSSGTRFLDTFWRGCECWDESMSK